MLKKLFLIQKHSLFGLKLSNKTNFYFHLFSSNVIDAYAIRPTKGPP